MTLCCQCVGVTPPPPPDPGACCSKVEGEVYTQCDDNVEYSDCMLKEMGIHHPNKTCAQLRIDNNYPTERTDWPEPACDLLGSCCFYFSPPFDTVNRACQNSVPSGTCEKEAVINGRQNRTCHHNSFLNCLAVCHLHYHDIRFLSLPLLQQYRSGFHRLIDSQNRG